MSPSQGYFRPCTLEGPALQATLLAGSTTGGPQPVPHHPLTCKGPLAYYANGAFECAHAGVGPDDERTALALNQSIAMLVIECAFQRETQ